MLNCHMLVLILGGGAGLQFGGSNFWKTKLKFPGNTINTTQQKGIFRPKCHFLLHPIVAEMCLSSVFKWKIYRCG